ncbi:uncharacterized protein LOC130145934 [Falco biarmicus]|uniref:uncharacterized protein LOC114014536 n=1 Tax=Falco cherrug TaxID=345164 RepID=UPI0024798AF6|nr:uncharacterized protein LOC114014536 [Falco cherrug]XP_056187474.1 uncharacterized protein LOC130145934 [Falco biarmicus]
MPSFRGEERKLVNLFSGDSQALGTGATEPRVKIHQVPTRAGVGRGSRPSRSCHCRGVPAPLSFQGQQLLGLFVKVCIQARGSKTFSGTFFSLKHSVFSSRTSARFGNFGQTVLEDGLVVDDPSSIAVSLLDDPKRQFLTPLQNVFQKANKILAFLNSLKRFTLTAAELTFRAHKPRLHFDSDLSAVLIISSPCSPSLPQDLAANRWKTPHYSKVYKPG